MTPQEIEVVAIRAAMIAIDQYSVAHPRPSHVTMRQAAEMLDISHPTLKKLIDAGTLKLNLTGRIPITLIDRAITARS